MSLAVTAESIATALADATLPEPRLVELWPGGDVRLQVDSVDSVAVWAGRHDAAVTLTETTTHVDVRSWFTVRGCGTQAWTQLTHAQAFRLRHAIGSDLDAEPYSLDPAAAREAAVAAG